MIKDFSVDLTLHANQQRIDVRESAGSVSKADTEEEGLTNIRETVLVYLESV